jgi:hypothetical protein
MVLVATKARDDARAAIKLAKAGYGPQAAGLSRSLVEAAINAEYIMGDPEKRGNAFLRSIKEENKRLAKRMMPHETSAEIKAAVDEALKLEEESGWPRNLGERAYKIATPHYGYDIVFFMLSQLLHSSVSSVAGQLHESDPGDWRLRYDRGPEWVDTALVTIFIFFFALANSVYSTFKLDKTQIESLRKDFEAVHKSQQSSATSGS